MLIIVGVSRWKIPQRADRPAVQHSGESNPGQRDHRAGLQGQEDLDPNGYALGGEGAPSLLLI